MSNRIVAVGEVLWDVFPEGPRFGGAPANVACHAAALGADAYMVSCVGDDELGHEALAFLESRGVKTAGLSRSAERPTGTVQVELDPKGKPTYEIASPVAWDFIKWTDDLQQLAEQAEAVCFGTLAQRSEVSRETIQRFLRAASEHAFRVFDVNLRQSFYSAEILSESLELANVLKLNDEELPVLAEVAGINGPVNEQLEALRQQFRLHWVAMTLGSEGAVIASKEGIVECPGVSTDIRDTVGAGDSFTAALTLGMLRGLPPAQVGNHACRIAAYVCSQAGATPELPEDLKSFG